jgi:transposase
MPKELTEEQRKEAVKWMSEHEDLDWKAHSERIKLVYDVVLSPVECSEMFISSLLFGP